MKDESNQSATLVVDLDHTLTMISELDYDNKPVNKKVVEKLVEYKNKGYEIIINTSRNMRTYKGDVSRINKYTLPSIVNWLEKNNIPYDGVVVGKPWCGHDGFYIDDRAIRPSEFVSHNEFEIKELLKKELETIAGQR